MQFVLKECDNWYYLNKRFEQLDKYLVLKECDNWYYLNLSRFDRFHKWFLRNAIIGII